MDPLATKKSNSCINRPPVVVFMIFLASFALTLFSLSVYVAQTEKIRNPDVLDWNSLLSRLEKLEICFPREYNETRTLPGDRSQITEASLSLPLSQDMAERFYAAAGRRRAGRQTAIVATGLVEVAHLGYGLPAEFVDGRMSLSFELPTAADGFTGDRAACLTVTGQAGLLEHLKAQQLLAGNETCGKAEAASVAAIPMLTHSPDHKPADWCSDDVQVEAALGDQRPQWSLYITPKDRELVQMHLMATSVFVFAMLAVVMITNLVRGVARGKRPHHQARDASSRGDHVLLEHA